MKTLLLTIPLTMFLPSTDGKSVEGTFDIHCFKAVGGKDFCHVIVHKEKLTCTPDDKAVIINLPPPSLSAYNIDF